MKVEWRLRRSERSKGKSRQAGYAFFMAFFMITAMLITSQIVLRNVATEGRRERETEMVWRGNQYIRAIRIFYRKTGHYPQSMDDLQKGLPNLHFLRAVTFKDPMNTQDGAWRLIYVTASGQIIGSTRYATLQQMALMDLYGGTLPAGVGQTAQTNPATPDTGAGPNPNPTHDINTQNQNQLAPTNASPFGASPMGGNSLNQGVSPFSSSLNQGSNPLAQQQPTGPVDGPVFGGFVAGVGGGKGYDRSSVRVYKGGTTYQKWEFIWNPLEDQARAIQSGLAPQQGGPGQPAGQQPGQTGGPQGLPIANPNGGAPAPPDIAPGNGQQPDQPQQ